ncbi:MAG: NfeD family protein [Alphaproteobacteria bacterium]|nr:NfeD family protein [Alphaproteobacteria bacterium]
MAAWQWIAIAVALGLLEIVVPGFILIWPAMAAAVVGLVMFVYPLGWEGQLALFAPLMALSVWGGVTWRKRQPKGRKSSALNVGLHRHVGKRASLETAIVNGRGSARIGDTVWPVQGPDLPAGSTVRVTGTDGTVLMVEREAD